MKGNGNKVLDIIDINPREVVFDELNPNVMSDKEYQSLILEIKKRGFVQPVVIRMKDGVPYIIDGEHRVRASIDLGFESIPAINIGDVSDEEARVMLINLNRIKGEFSPVKFAELLEDLDLKLKEKLVEEVYMSEKELDSYRLLRKIKNVEDSEIESIIQDTQLQNEIVKGSVLHLDSIKPFEINADTGVVSIGELSISKERIKKMTINFDKNLKAFMHVEILPEQHNEEDKEVAVESDGEIAE